LRLRPDWLLRACLPKVTRKSDPPSVENISPGGVTRWRAKVFSLWEVPALWTGIAIDPTLATGRQVCDALIARGIFTKDTHVAAIRLAPPLVVPKKPLDWGIDQRETVPARLISY